MTPVAEARTRTDAIDISKILVEVSGLMQFHRLSS